MLQNNIQLKVFVFLWRWWSARNKANDGGRMPMATEICGSVSFFLMQFEKLHETKERIKSVPQGSWTPPLGNIYKINSDGSFDPDKRSGGWGFMVRNINGGEILAAGAGNIRHASSALHAEVAAYKSIIHAAQLGMSQIILETDAMVLATALKSTNIDEVALGLWCTIFET
jgi:hypothetical protein